MAMSPAEAIARRFIELYNDGTPESYGSDRVLELYADDVDWREFIPSARNPQGRSGSLAALREAILANQGALRNRRVRLHDVVAEPDRAAMRYAWEAEVGVDGTPFGRRGSVLRAEVAAFFKVADGKIVQCYEFGAFLPNG